MSERVKVWKVKMKGMPTGYRGHGTYDSVFLTPVEHNIKDALEGLPLDDVEAIELVGESVYGSTTRAVPATPEQKAPGQE